MANRKVAAKPKRKAGPLMYVGPTVPGFGIQNRVYTEIPAAAAAIIKGDAELGFLFIPISRYPEANRMLREQEGHIFRAFKKALKLKK